MMAVTECLGTVLFVLAICHTFATGFFDRLAQRSRRYAGLWHLMSDVEMVFGFWALIFVALMMMINGVQSTTADLDALSFSEPMFVFVIMVVSATRPIRQVATTLGQWLARMIPLPAQAGSYVTLLSLTPLLGAFITEPAAMTLAALMLAEVPFFRGFSSHLKYLTVGVLFVNVSIGGTLTAFSAPPVLMVADAWGWDTGFMMRTFGWKAGCAVLINAVITMLLAYPQLTGPDPLALGEAKKEAAVPLFLIVLHLAILIGIVLCAHHLVLFVGLFLMFLGIAHVTARHQDRLLLREGLLVAVFLAGLVILGSKQHWWLRPTLMAIDEHQAFWGAALLTAWMDNAAITYLASLIDTLTDGLKYAIVAGAVTGGGLTLIANAPNPAGAAILRHHFDGNSIHPLRLMLAAFLPTVIAALIFFFL